jgi:hypothetical protein
MACAAAPHAGRRFGLGMEPNREAQTRAKNSAIFVINPIAFSKYCHNTTAGSRSIEGESGP